MDRQTHTLRDNLAFMINLARPERFELPTTWFEARYSIQLSYGRAVDCYGVTINQIKGLIQLLF